MRRRSPSNAGPRFPVGPKGRFAPSFRISGGLEFRQKQGGGQERADDLSQPLREKMVAASGGYDLPAFENLDHPETWPRKGAQGHALPHPNPHNHQKLSISASPAPPKIAQQIYTRATLTKMCVRFYQGEPMRRRWPGRKATRRLHAKLRKFLPPRLVGFGRGGVRHPLAETMESRRRAGFDAKNFTSLK